jgi:hypothetical protein
VPSVSRTAWLCRLCSPLYPGLATYAGACRVIETHKGDKRYVRRNKQGQFKENDDVGRSLSQDRKRKAKTVAKKGEGDRGDRKR